MKAHQLAHELLAHPDGDVVTHEPEYDQYHPTCSVRWYDGRIYLTPGYAAAAFKAPPRSEA